METAGRQKRALNYAWIILAACLVIGIISFSIRFSFGVFFKSIEDEFLLNRAATSGVQSLFQLLGCVVAPLGGLALDRFGPKKVFTAAGIVTALALVLTSRATALWHLYLSYSILVAVGTSAINSMILATTSRWFVRRRGLAVGIVTSAISLGMMSAPVISFFITRYSWQTAYLLLGLVALGLWVPGAFLLKRNPALSLPSSDETPAQELRAESISLFQAVKHGAFWLCFFIWLTQAFGTFMIMTHLVPYATDSGLSAGQAASIISVMGAASLLGRLTMGRLADVQSKKLIGAAGIVLMCLAMFWLIWATNLWMLVVFGVVFGLGMGGSGPAMIAIVADLFGTRYLGGILGAMDTSFGIGSALGPAAAGFIFDLRHSYTLAFLIAAIFIVVSLVLFLVLRISPHSSSDSHSKLKTQDS